MGCLHSSWQMTASLPLPLVADDFDRPSSLCVRFQQLARVWAIDHSCWIVSLEQTTWPDVELTVLEFR